MNKTLHTKFGTATINNHGYYQITSRKEGHKGKLLHRLLFEDFYNITLLKNYSVHHKDGNKLNNCILNLQLLPRIIHHKLHSSGKNNPMYNKQFTKEHRDRLSKGISKGKNTTGYYRVYKQKSNRYKQGFRYRYLYLKNGKQKAISSVDLDKLKQKVIDKGLTWMEI